MPWDPLPGHSPEPRRVGDTLDAALRGLGVQSGDVVRAVFDRWTEIVGPRLAGRCRPVRMRSGALVVAADDAIWAREVAWQEAAVLAAVRALSGSEEIARVEVVVARRDPT